MLISVTEVKKQCLEDQTQENTADHVYLCILMATSGGYSGTISFPATIYIDLYMFHICYTIRLH